jgi:hypothetical protein
MLYEAGLPPAPSPSAGASRVRHHPRHDNRGYPPHPPGTRSTWTCGLGCRAWLALTACSGISLRRFGGLWTGHSSCSSPTATTTPPESPPWPRTWERAGAERTDCGMTSTDPDPDAATPRRTGGYVGACVSTRAASPYWATLAGLSESSPGSRSAGAGPPPGDCLADGVRLIPGSVMSGRPDVLDLESSDIRAGPPHDLWGRQTAGLGGEQQFRHLWGVGQPLVVGDEAVAHVGRLAVERDPAGPLQQRPTRGGIRVRELCALRRADHRLWRACSQLACVPWPDQ